MANNYQEKIAKILRVDKKRIIKLESALNLASGKNNVLKQIIEENDESVRSHLDILGLGRNVSAVEVYDALISKIEADDMKIFDSLNLFSLRTPGTADKIVNFVKKLHPPQKGFFLKHAKAEEFLINEPPKKILEALKYRTVEEMLMKEDLLEVYSALRFLEDTKWQNEVFFKQYENLQPEDFEERTIHLQALHPKWAKAAEKFVSKKYHNVSHLKELGVIFVIPVFLGISGETLRLISLITHYLNEVQYYSDLFILYMEESKAHSKELGSFKRFSHFLRFGKKDGKISFANNVISLLRGDVLDHRLPGGKRQKFLVIQRYLAKDDENDWRLFEPHINPEAIHWRKAEEEIVMIENILPGIKGNLGFWQDLDWVGDFFKDEIGNDTLVSFNLVDTVMALVKEKELIKYLYHHQEALWNKIFSSYFGEERMLKSMKDNMIKGWFEV